MTASFLVFSLIIILLSRIAIDLPLIFIGNIDFFSIIRMYNKKIKIRMKLK